MIPDYPWFGPRHGMGWGWTPVSWEGKVLTYAVIVAITITAFGFGRYRKAYYVIGGLVMFLLAVCAVTGTAPG